LVILRAAEIEKLNMKINRNSLFIGAVLCALRLAGQSAAEPSSRNAWENQLSANSVGAAQMQSFHQRAGQKLRDFADLLTLVADPAMDEALRQESKAAALALFSDKSVSIHWHGKQFPLESFLSQIGKSASGTQFGIAEFKGYPPGACAQRNCKWDTVFYWVEKTPNGKPQQYPAAMSVVLKKVKKQFGGQEKESWEVFLGEVR
jgi:hypothetical protein